MVLSSAIGTALMGAFFGLTAGISPGPLLTLVISETLRHGKKEGIKVAMAPLITDIPIILVSWFIFSKISQYNIILSIISLAGGIFFSYLGYETIRAKNTDTDFRNHNPDSLKKGIAANLLNPHPYIFWMTIGIPVAFRAYKANLFAAILYFLLFYIMLIGSKVIIALLTERSKGLMRNSAYKITMKALGIALLFFALLFFYDGIKSIINF